MEDTEGNIYRYGQMNVSVYGRPELVAFAASALSFTLELYDTWELILRIFYGYI